MRRYILIASAGLLVCAAPAFAQSSPSFPQELDEEIARALPHPYDVEEAGDKVGRAVDAILDVPVGGVVQAIDPRARVHRDETLGGLAGRDDPYFEERVQDRVGSLSLEMADMMRKIAYMAPVLRRSLADFERNLEGAIRSDDYDRDR